MFLRQPRNHLAMASFSSKNGRLFIRGKSIFRRRTKQLPLARKPKVLVHVAKRTSAHSFLLSRSVFPSHFFWILSCRSLDFIVSTTWWGWRLSSMLFPQIIKTFHFFLRKSPPSPCDRCLRNMKDCDHVGLIQTRFLTAATVSCVPRNTVRLFRYGILINNDFIFLHLHYIKFRWN